MNLKKSIAIMLASVVVASQGIIGVSAEIINNDGKVYYQESDGKYAHGWKNINGKKYYFKSNGVAVTGTAKIGGVMYKFDSEGICLGKLTGFVKSKGKIIYYSKGTTLSGWQKIKDNWYFINSDGSVNTGNSTVYGKELTFSNKGVWNGEVSGYAWQNIVLSAEKKLSQDDYGYYSVDNNMFILHMKNPSAADKYLSGWKEKYPAIIVDKVKFSASDLKTVKNHIDKNMKKYGLLDSYTNYDKNCIQITTKKINGEFQKYMDSLDDPNIISVELGNVTETDD